MNTDRDAFEEWYLQDDPEDAVMERKVGGAYVEPEVELAWGAWQEAIRYVTEQGSDSGGARVQRQAD